MTIDIHELRQNITTYGLEATCADDLIGLLDRLEAAEKERDALRAKIEQMEKHEMTMPDIKKVPFDVVEVWYNDLYTPYTISPTRKDSRRAFAFKIEDEFFLIGEKDQDNIHICDYPNRSSRDEDA